MKLKRALLLSLVAAAACAPASSEVPPTLPSPYLPGIEAPPIVPALDAAGVAGVIVRELPDALRQSPDLLLATYDALAPAGATCAEEREVSDEDGTVVELWASYAGCASEDGTIFRGAAIITRFTEVPREGDGALQTGFSMSSEGGSFVVEGTDGRALRFTGYLHMLRMTGAESSQASLYMTGTFLVEGEPDAPPLLTGGIRGELDLYSYAEPSGYRALSAEGTVTGEALTDATAVALQGFVVASAPCAEEPAGSISVRDSAAAWHDVVFDADGGGDDDDDDDESGGPNASVCDGCGAHFVSGVAGGEAVCLDGLGALLDWQGMAW